MPLISAGHQVFYLSAVSEASLGKVTEIILAICLHRGTSFLFLRCSRTKDIFPDDTYYTWQQLVTVKQNVALCCTDL